jgi:hypothetical protein
VYPSALFSLQKDETYPYERYAYNVLSIAIEAFQKQDLPLRVTVDFTHEGQTDAPWVINASIEFHLGQNGHPLAFIFRMPELTPAILYLFTATIVTDFFDADAFEGFRKKPDTLRARFQHFGQAVTVAIREYRARGFGYAIRAAYEHLGLNMGTLQKCADEYNLLAMQMAYHEVAHGYLKQVTREGTTKIEASAFELLADLVAVAWFYNHMIVNTPDTEEYRDFRRLESHADSIFSNAILALRSQQALLILMAVAGSQRSGGAVSLAADKIHPPGMQRFMLQHVMLYTLIASNFANLLLPEHFEAFQKEWDDKLDTLIRAGVIPLKDIEAILDARECDTIEAAASLIEELRVPELQKLLPTLRAMRDWLTDAIARRRKR